VPRACLHLVCLGDFDATNEPWQVAGRNKWALACLPSMVSVSMHDVSLAPVHLTDTPSSSHVRYAVYARHGTMERLPISKRQERFDRWEDAPRGYAFYT
jgi:hypothetical protein